MRIGSNVEAAGAIVAMMVAAAATLFCAFIFACACFVVGAGLVMSWGEIPALTVGRASAMAALLVAGSSIVLGLQTIDRPSWPGAAALVASTALLLVLCQIALSGIRI